MRTLAADLAAEQVKPSRRPFVEVIAVDAIGSVPRLHWEHLYSGAEPDGPHAVAMPADRSLNRLRIESNTLYRQRVINPSQYSDFSLWTSFRTTTINCALAPYGATLLAFAVHSTTPTQVYWCTSTDNGASWSAWALLCTAPAVVLHIAAFSKSNGDTLVILSTAAQIVYSIKRASSVWGALTVWTNLVHSITGLAGTFYRDFNIVITGTDHAASNPSVWSCIYGDGIDQALDTWSGLTLITEAAAGVAIAYSCPFAYLYGLNDIRISYREAYTGANPYDRMNTTQETSTFLAALWAEPLPFNLTHLYGLALAYNATYPRHWATTPSRVYRTDQVASVNLTDDVISCTANDSPLDPAGATIRIDNHDGRYNTPGVGDLLALSRGSRIDIFLGYHTASGPLSSAGPSYYIEAIDHESGGGRRELVIHCHSAWGLLHAWRPGRSYRWPNTLTYIGIIAVLLAKVSIHYNGGSLSTKMFVDTPDFAVIPGYDPPAYITGYYCRWYWHTSKTYAGKKFWHCTPIYNNPPPEPGTYVLPYTSALAAIAALYAQLEDRPLFRWDMMYNCHPQASDPSVYAFGTTHPIEYAAYRQLQADNRFLTFGAQPSVFAEAIDYDGIALLHDRPRHAHDKNIATAADAADRSTREARDAVINSRADTIVIPPHCGIELWDVIDVTDPGLGLAAAKRRVTGITTIFSRDKPPAYYQVLTLGEP